LNSTLIGDSHHFQMKAVCLRMKVVTVTLLNNMLREDLTQRRRGRKLP